MELQDIQNFPDMEDYLKEQEQYRKLSAPQLTALAEYVLENSKATMYGSWFRKDFPGWLCPWSGSNKSSTCLALIKRDLLQVTNYFVDWEHKLPSKLREIPKEELEKGGNFSFHWHQYLVKLSPQFDELVKHYSSLLVAARQRKQDSKAEKERQQRQEYQFREVVECLVNDVLKKHQCYLFSTHHRVYDMDYFPKARFEISVINAEYQVVLAIRNDEALGIELKLETRIYPFSTSEVRLNYLLDATRDSISVLTDLAEQWPQVFQEIHSRLALMEKDITGEEDFNPAELIERK